MTSFFDGMGSILNNVLGDVVSVTPPAGIARDQQAIFREGPEPVMGRDGIEIMTVMPTLSGLELELSDLLPPETEQADGTPSPGGTVRPGNGKQYICIATMKSGSPASDRLIKIELEEIDYAPD